MFSTPSGRWFLILFSGTYDQKFYDWLIRIGRIHVKHSVDPHYMSRAMNIVRDACIDILSRTDDSSELTASKIIALGKILDLNLDIVNMAYFEEEIKILAPVYKVKSFLIDFSEKFSNAMNLILVLALIGLTLSVVALFFYDVQKLFYDDLYHGIISALGSLLILWVMIELMATEIAHLKGGKFYISVFIGVALVTVIRDTMIAILKHEKPDTVYMLIAAILVIGFIYWLVIKAEEHLKK